MKTSIYDLVYEYISLFNTTKPKEAITGDFVRVLKEKWTAGEILSHLKDFHEKMPGQEPADLLAFFSNRRKKEVNLVLPGDINFHQELIILPPPPKVSVNYDTGVIEQKYQEYYMEPVASYTANELLEYYYKRMMDKPEDWKSKRYSGALSYLLTKVFTLDHLLYTIDAVGDLVLDKEIPIPETPNILQDYYKDGMAMMQNCVTEIASRGGYEVVLRERIPVDRGRSENTGVLSALLSDAGF